MPVKGGPSESLASALDAIRAVGPEGRGNAEATAAWKRAADSDATALVTILGAMDGANDFAANYLRTAVGAVAARAEKEGGTLPLADLGTFLLDTRHDPRARRLSFDLLAKADPATTDKLLAGMLNDPSLELRYDAVQKVVAQAEAAGVASNKLGETLLYRQALVSARDIEQVDNISKKLEELGQPVDLVKLSGFLTDWKVVGPFDNTGAKGFAAIYPPEQSVEPDAVYDGKTNKIKWRDVGVTDKHGRVDLNEIYGKQKGVVAYGLAEFYSERAQAAEVRVGCGTSWKVWLNGKPLFSRDEYHFDSTTEEHALPVELEAGRNTILLKVCQDELVEDWTVDWDFRLRVTDAIGTPIASSAPVKVAATTTEKQ